MPIPVGRAVPLFQGRATSNLELTTAGQWYSVLLAQEDINVGGGHSTSTNTARWTAPFACTIAVTGQALFANGQTWSSTSPTFRWASIFKNGVQISGGGFDVYNGQWLTVDTFPGYILSMANGDYVELRAASSFAATNLYGDAGLGSLLKVEQIR